MYWRGLFSLLAILVSVPIRGLFNLTLSDEENQLLQLLLKVSVPIRGLFNLTCNAYGVA